uniref:F-box domain-containing protein n=1 Tax=Leersia perrieri TaxID=77586 RepID=A0A0D9X761_9ORYZ
MPPKKSKLFHEDGDATGAEDRLSALPDAPLHHVMSFLRAWEVARTCMLSCCWRHLCVTRLAWRWTPSASAKTRQVRLPILARVGGGRAGGHSTDDVQPYVDSWIHAAIRRSARVIQVSEHPKDEAFSNFDNVPIISCHLKHLKLSGLLIMVGFTIDAPCLVLLRRVTPYNIVPLFQNVGSLTLDAATIVLDDSYLFCGYEYQFKDIDGDAIEGSGSTDSESSLNDSCYEVTLLAMQALVNTVRLQMSMIMKNSLQSMGHNQSKHGNYHAYDHNNKFNLGKVLGGHNVLHNLSIARSFELLADAGEVILNRELKTCPNFINLKTLSLGEWCMGPEFDPLVSFLQHSPNLERLYLELKFGYGNKQAMKDSIKPDGRSFFCAHLKMVNISLESSVYRSIINIVDLPRCVW